MGEMGVSPRPTVAQWLRGKQEQRKRAMQDALINWDRSLLGRTPFLNIWECKYDNKFRTQQRKTFNSCLRFVIGKSVFFIAFTQTVLAGEPQVVVFAVFPLKGQPIMRNSLHFSNKFSCMHFKENKDTFVYLISVRIGGVLPNRNVFPVPTAGASRRGRRLSWSSRC